MKNRLVKGFTILAAAFLMSVSVLEMHAEARAGGGRSMGSRGGGSYSRSYSRPTPNYTQPSQPRPQLAPTQSPFQQQAGGGFLRSMAGGVMGGMLGSMLFSGLAGAGVGHAGMGGGIGLFEIALMAGVGYLIFRYVRNRRKQDHNYYR